jgi:hypothetical protein
MGCVVCDLITRGAGNPRPGGAMGPPELEKESPESWSEEFGADGIEALPRRVDRYGKAKKVRSM